MKYPLQALLIAPGVQRERIVAGTQTATIRPGHRGYTPGPVMLCCHLVPWVVQADIVSVRHCTLKQVAYEEYRAECFASHNELTEHLKKYYSDISDETPVTVIRWENVRGALVCENDAVCTYNI